MPIYEYRCENGHEFDVFQRMSDDALSVCQVCGGAAQRVLSAPAVHFKGSGFYTTDYSKSGSKTKAGGGDGDGDSSGGDSDSSKSEKQEKKSDSTSKSESSGAGSGDKAKASSAD